MASWLVSFAVERLCRQRGRKPSTSPATIAKAIMAPMMRPRLDGDFAAGLLFASAAGPVGVEDWVEYGKRRFVSVLAGDSGAMECFPSCGVSGTSLCFDSPEFMNKSLGMSRRRQTIVRWCGLIRFVCFGRGNISVQNTEYDRHEKEGGHRGEHQAPNHSPAEGRVLFAAFAQPQRHGHHANDHRHCRH